MIFLNALEALNVRGGNGNLIVVADCVVIED